VIQLADRPILIDEACSGVHSLFAVLAGTVFLVLWARRSPLRGIALVAAAVVWVVLSNVLRIVLVVAVAARGRGDLLGGWAHEALGLAVFLVALGLTASTDSLLSVVPCFFRFRRASLLAELAVPRGVPAPAVDVDGAPVGRRVPACLPELGQTRLASWRLAGAYGVLLLAQPLLIGTRLVDQLAPGAFPGSRLLALRVGDLPERSGPFQRQGLETEQRAYGNPFGRFSQRWMYRFGNRMASVSVDGPFLGWHELSQCYASRGWTCRERTVEPGAGGAGAIAAVRLEGRPGQAGDLLFSLFDERGRVLEPENPGDRAVILRDRLMFWRSSSRRRTYQVQLLVPGAAPLTDAEREQARAFFQQVRRELAERVSRGGREVSS
jgi:exosortase/archaeosortase family protein